ncbi:hypothetical protein [Actinophytocola algeriensis]|uniref:Uncharacterized protein n=1 Tax=Actinophytocola algeriensis TaxID=1768010 RepID=A0A7W7VD59_9PSEU|nr:hypothetical protein [Actinophytocola algeriensis]MBB4905878.1 hypothetical protein [Actinophytocola algeriensis]MBE1472437.1 hypothetical protein [Actinophytocola algeriensis]
MPKLAGRGVLIAALAVPVALAAAPLTASADEPYDVVMTDQMTANAVATEDGAAAAAAATNTTFVEESEDVWHGPDPDVEYVPEVIYSTEDEDTTEITEDAAEELTEESTEEVTEESTEESTEETSTEAVAVVTPVDQTWGTYTDDDLDDSTDAWAGASYENIAAYAGADGAWVTSTESHAVAGDDSGLSGSDTAVWHEQTTAAAGEDGAYVESTESGAFESDGWGHGGFSEHHHHHDVTGAMFEHTAAAAGEDGAWVENLESAAFEQD